MLLRSHFKIEAPLLFILVFMFCCLLTMNLQPVGAAEKHPPDVGDKAQEFKLNKLDGKTINLSQYTKKGPVVLMVLRGYPGYQCPICNRQVGQYIAAAAKLKKANTTVLMVYPGPADKLKTRAEEFITGKTLPENFHLLIDPGYSFTEAWGLRWNAPQETAYPSTFVVDRNQKIRFAKISKTHGDRAPVKDILNVLTDL
ncbi:Putative peroxiredoxin [Gimesia panareensis]|uniref:thioredoxin-dependent peroxiredoxin n=1 Tax=Gimesia panareensis TaxID=2527978 RepID=A0A518FW89_9PLAN|nr:peroxiredoxin family protein [Gimesia panareensis]QDV20591.1 Putative peroxiredoxin [Gimesia panareensis]